MKTKRCSICNVRKEISRFTPAPQCRGHVRPNCKACGVKDATVHRTKIREMWASGHLKRKTKKKCPMCQRTKPFHLFAATTLNKSGLAPYCLSCVRKSHRDLRRADIGPYLVRSARSRAKKSGIKFNLRRGDLIVPTHCPALGTPLVIGDGVMTRNSPTIDRIDNRKGYVRGNVIVVSYLANAIKTDATPEQIRKVADFYLSLNWRPS